jgi:hypothetical protein
MTFLTTLQLNLLLNANPCGIAAGEATTRVNLAALADAGLLHRDCEGIYHLTEAGHRRARVEMKLEPATQPPAPYDTSPAN